MFDDLQDMDDDSLKKVKMVAAFGAALVVLLVLALVLGELLGEKSPRHKDRVEPRAPSFGDPE